MLGRKPGARRPEETTMDQPDARTSVTVRDALPLRLHHNAFVVKDHEVNRRFFEDLLGMPLVATWCEKNVIAEVEREVEFCHTFFALADGGALAFFQFADEAVWELNRAILHPSGTGSWHCAFKVTQGTFDELRKLSPGFVERICLHGAPSHKVVQD